MVMEGRGDGAARIPLVPCDHAIQAGDVVYAQEKPGLLDVPVIVAEVAQCKRDPDNPTGLGYHRPARLRSRDPQRRGRDETGVGAVSGTRVRGIRMDPYLGSD